MVFEKKKIMAGVTMALAATARAFGGQHECPIMFCVMMTQFAHSFPVLATVTSFHIISCDAIWTSHCAKIIIYIINMLYSFFIIL